MLRICRGGVVAVHLGYCRDDGQAQAGAGLAVRRDRAARERFEGPLQEGCREAAPPSSTWMCSTPSARCAVTAMISIPPACRSALSSRFCTACRIRTGWTRTGSSGAPTVIRTPAAPARSSKAATAATSSSRSETVARRSRSRPRRVRASASRSSTSWTSWSGQGDQPQGFAGGVGPHPGEVRLTSPVRPAYRYARPRTYNGRAYRAPLPLEGEPDPLVQAERAGRLSAQNRRTPRSGQRCCSERLVGLIWLSVAGLR